MIKSMPTAPQAGIIARLCIRNYRSITHGYPQEIAKSQIKKYKDSLLKGGTDPLDQIEPLGELVDLLRRMGPM